MSVSEQMRFGCNIFIHGNCLAVSRKLQLAIEKEEIVWMDDFGELEMWNSCAATHKNPLPRMCGSGKKALSMWK